MLTFIPQRLGPSDLPSNAPGIVPCGRRVASPLSKLHLRRRQSPTLLFRRAMSRGALGVRGKLLSRQRGHAHADARASGSSQDNGLAAFAKKAPDKSPRPPTVTAMINCGSAPSPPCHVYQPHRQHRGSLSSNQECRRPYSFEEPRPQSQILRLNLEDVRELALDDIR